MNLSSCGVSVGGLCVVWQLPRCLALSSASFWKCKLRLSLLDNCPGVFVPLKFRTDREKNRQTSTDSRDRWPSYGHYLQHFDFSESARCTKTTANHGWCHQNVTSFRDTRVYSVADDNCTRPMRRKRMLMEPLECLVRLQQNLRWRNAF